LRFVHPGLGTFGVLICYDLSHFEILWAINHGQHRDPVDILFVVANNPDGKLYRACCLADCHRFYQYIALCNVAKYGRSGIFGPLRTAGERQVLLDAGAGGEAVVAAEVDLAGLRAARAATDEDLDRGRHSFRKKPGVFQVRFDTPPRQAGS